ncbi:MAG TPA: beta-N-acetylhexosaminidase [Bacteroidetes bacterium]|nr:beta-N-acetylhexosaminidase [Bacteroidota bacterium]
MKKSFSLFAILFALLFVSAATFNRQDSSTRISIEEIEKEQSWVDSIFQIMTPDERLGQLVWIRAQSDWSQANMDRVAEQIEKYHIGGLCFFNPTFKGSPEKQVELTNRYQALAKHVPLFVSLDAEWGVGWRYKGKALAFPRQMMLGAIQDKTLIYEMGKTIARHLRRIGVTLNFAPVADVNNNAANPVINYRSFGEAPRNVAAKAYQYMRGMQDNGVMACAKHFPGHGDTDTDSHKDLPVIPHTMARLDSIELYPFKMLIQQGVGSIMVAHLHVPALDPSENLPTTLSYPTVTGLLKNKLHFNGIVMTDALEMKGVTKYHGPGEVEAKALAAGNDVLLMPSNVDVGFRVVKKWLAEGKLDSSLINKSVKKVLRWKYRMGIIDYENIKVENVRADVNDFAAKALRRKLIENALTLVRNGDNIIPLGNPKNGGFEKMGNIAALAIGAKKGNPFHTHLNFYKNIETYTAEKNISTKQQNILLNKLKNKDAVIVSLHDMSQKSSKGFGISQNTKEFINKLRQQTKVILTVFGNAYSLKYFDGINNILLAYEEADDVQEIAAQALFGAYPIQGRLPVTVTEKSKAGMGVVTPSLQRLSYGLPEEVGMSSDKLMKIDSFVYEAINKHATPGAVVLVARKGKVVFQKAYGKHSYDKSARATKTSDIFDLASVTKIAASTVSLMKLQDEGKFDYNDPAKKYLPELIGSNKADIPLSKMLTHHARLTTWIKFYENTISAKKQPLPKFYRSKPEGKYNLPVAKNLYLRDDYPDTIWKQIIDSPMLPGNGYKYSDLAFYIAHHIINKQAGEPLEDYVQNNFYKPMGMETTTYRPLEKFPLDRMPPTEEDRYFRQRRIQGYVHDMGAAMLDQVSGHAGLFSNANDLAKLMQMLLNKGSYGGTQYLQPQTIHQYATRCNGCTRRGLGFDMLQLDRRHEPNLSPQASESTFGHLGFTGIAAWVDPENELVYIFLSNRTYPKMKPNKLGDMNTRVYVMDAVYEAIVE